jgi:ribosomal protein S27E
MSFEVPPIPYPDSDKITCKKCGYEVTCDPAWLKASSSIGCPNCGTMIHIPKPPPE